MSNNQIAKVLQTGATVNTVVQIGAPAVVKVYQDSDHRDREIAGLKAWRKGTNCVPSVYAHSDNIVCFEFVSKKDSSHAKNKFLLIQRLIEQYVAVGNAFSYQEARTNRYYENWRLYISKTLSDFETIARTFFDDHSSNVTSAAFYTSITLLQKIDWSAFQKYPLHRDIHWGNILSDKDSFVLIDFEHYCLGPVEYEFANCLFWNDAKSLDVSIVASVLQTHGIFFNIALAKQLVSLYFAEQLTIALHMNDEAKAITLIRCFARYSKVVSKEATKQERFLTH